MRSSALLVALCVSACSPSKADDAPKKRPAAEEIADWREDEVIANLTTSDRNGSDSLDSGELRTVCITEEMLREANASEADIKQFRKDQAAANNEASCD